MKTIALGGNYYLTYTSETEWDIRDGQGNIDTQGYIQKLASTLIQMREEFDATVQ